MSPSQRQAYGESSVRVTDEGFVLSTTRDVFSARWDDVRRISAFKRDLVTTDSVCLEIFLHASGEIWELCDETDGFWELVRAIKRVYPESQQEWQRAVMHPAFAERHTLILER